MALPRSGDFPAPQGLYDPRNEHDACGVNFVVNYKGVKSHDIVQTGIGALCRMQHRGALGSEPNTGDGAGILLQVPDRFYRAVVSFELPPERQYATGIAFLPQSESSSSSAIRQMEKIFVEEGLTVLGWREVPTIPMMLGAGARRTMPNFKQVFIAGNGEAGIDLDRLCYVARKRVEHEVVVPAGADEANEALVGESSQHDGVYMPSLSSRTIVYKGMLTTPQLGQFYPDLVDSRVESALALVHSRFSTNTFPSWPLAHPYRMVAHNGEINTVAGNENWMKAREALLSSPHLGENIERIFPICTPGSSDTARFDEALELLVLGGYSMPQAMLMMIPEPWERHEAMNDDLKSFYRYHASLMEPWDGPASIAFTDGDVVGAVLDRNGLRPSRYWVTDDDMVIMASEVGVVDVPNDKIVEKGRLQPGRMFFIDLGEGRIIRDAEIKQKLAAANPYHRWIEDHRVSMADLPEAGERETNGDLVELQSAFGWTHEDVKLLLAPMARSGKEALGSMGTDTPVAVLSNRSRLLYDYFQQLFAQVTNPPLDAIREQIVTATLTWLGSEANLLDPTPASCAQILSRHPVITNLELASLAVLDGTADGPVGAFKAESISSVFHAASGGDGLRSALDRIRRAASDAIDRGANLIILSDRSVDQEWAPIPALLATGAVHHHLVRKKNRTQVGLIVESAEAREVHHICALLGFGAEAVNPWLVFKTLDQMLDEPDGNNALALPETAHRNYVKACDAGVLKVMSKMGISTIKSYIGAQIFEAIGIGKEVIDDCFTGTASRLGGIGYDEIAEESLQRHRVAYGDRATERAHRTLEVGGEYQWRREGEHHLFNPETVFKLQHATRTGRYDIFKEYTGRVNDQSERLATIRGLLRINTDGRHPVPLDEVEPVSSIVKRFSTGAMSYGSISAEAHETLAIAMNRLGAKSNTGEGGEDSRRYTLDANGDSRRSAIKQAASGRFGVTSEYLTQADDIQIKMAQGAKPGEGGQLPAHKVWPWIAEVRHSTPGVGLISPPPHHDIYSIEDLAQLIHDLKNANPSARIHVKLVSELGVGTVAAGVSKAHADVVLISGHDGGTGASPLTSIKHCGTPWELGLAETQQTLVLNDLRDRVVVQCDGQLKTGRDVMIAALLGAEEFGFATAPLVVMGCIMMRVCHLDTCPVGVATQDPQLRENFEGQADHVVNFMEFVAEELRELMAELGFRSLDEAIGQSHLLDKTAAVDHWKAHGLDVSPILHSVPARPGSALYNTSVQDHGLDKALDVTLIGLAFPALIGGEKVELDMPISNQNRTVGTMLGHELTKRHGRDGLPEDSIVVNFTGQAGNSFGAFLPKGITLKLTGETNDFAGKGLSGGRLVVRAPEERHPRFKPHENIIAGNVLLYGATGGEAFFQGRVGERFCVRNSGAIAVVEGVGDHGCEYMTGGRVVVLGPTGRNFGAGMSGGIAFVFDADASFSSRVNHEMVDLDLPTAEDQVWLQERIRQHLTETNSDVATEILGDWEELSRKFMKVMPKDFKRVMRALAEADETGQDPDEAVMASSRS